MVVVPRRRARVSVPGKISSILRVLLLPVPPLGGQGLRLEQNGRNRNGNCQSARHDGRHLRRTGPVVPSPHQFRRRRSDAQQVQRKYTNRTIFHFSHPKKKSSFVFSQRHGRFRLAPRPAQTGRQRCLLRQTAADRRTTSKSTPFSFMDSIPNLSLIFLKVDSIIEEATNVDNLALLYEGWTPWV